MINGTGRTADHRQRYCSGLKQIFQGHANPTAFMEIPKIFGSEQRITIKFDQVDRLTRQLGHSVVVAWLRWCFATLGSRRANHMAAVVPPKVESVLNAGRRALGH